LKGKKADIHGKDYMAVEYHITSQECQNLRGAILVQEDAG